MFPVTVFILIGGKSKRFGLPKWKVMIENKTVLDRMWNSCSNFKNRFIVGKEKPLDLDKPFLQDNLKLSAPINGLYTALNNTTTNWILLLSCDLPLINSNLFKKIWNLNPTDIDCIIPLANGKAQVTCAFYHKDILSVMESQIREKKYSLHSLAEKINTDFVEFGDDKRFWNMNTKKDYEEIIKYVTDTD